MQQNRHGAYRVVRAFSEGRLDKRTKLYKYLKQVKENFTNEMGGELNIGQQLLLQKILYSLAFTKTVVSFVEQRGYDFIDESGRILPCINQNFLALHNALSRDIIKFYELEKWKESPAEKSLRAIMECSERESTSGR